MNNLFQMPEEKIETRWFSLENVKGEKGAGGTANHGRKGAACTTIKKDETMTLVDTHASGTIRRIWMTIEHKNVESLRGLKIEMYWDGADTPAVQAPIGDFFCHAMDTMVTFENACFSSPEGRSFNCIIPMPFKESAKILLINESGQDNTVFYEIDATIGETHDGNMLYFHSTWRRENPTQIREDMNIMPKLSGRGRFLGCNLGVRVNEERDDFWWGEGEVKIYLDGDDELPTLCGTGTEDYIGTGWGQGHYCHQFQGNHYLHGVDKADDSVIAKGYGFYRFHIPDPVYFYEDCKVDIQVIGGSYFKDLIKLMDRHPDMEYMKAGDGSECYTREEVLKNIDSGGLIERFDDHCATVYWYMDNKENGLSPIACVAERIQDLPIKSADEK